MNTIYLGEYHTALGDKNRVAIPKKLREKLTDAVVLTRGYESCLLLVDSQSWEKLITEINRRPLLQLNVRDTKRFLLGSAFELELDNQGRFVIPEGLLTYSGITGDLVFLGVGEWIEIWEATRWQAKLNYLAANAADVADRLSDQIGTENGA